METTIDTQRAAEALARAEYYEEQTLDARVDLDRAMVELIQTKRERDEAIAEVARLRALLTGAYSQAGKINVEVERIRGHVSAILMGPLRPDVFERCQDILERLVEVLLDTDELANGKCPENR